MKMQKKDRRRKIRGQGMAEYGILVAVIAILSIAIVTQFGDQIRQLFFSAGETMATGSDSATMDMDTHVDEGNIKGELGGGD